MDIDLHELELNYIPIETKNKNENWEDSGLKKILKILEKT